MINEGECVGCGICADMCPEGIEISAGKAKIVNGSADCIENAVGDCPRQAIVPEGTPQSQGKDIMRTGWGRGGGMGRGMGAGKGRGLGRGPRDGRGRGRGGGGRR